MRVTGKTVSAALLLGAAGCLFGGIARLDASAASSDWIKITSDNKYVYTLDESETKGAFAFNAANNGFNKTVCIDLGMKSDGVTAETEQNYVLSKIQLANLINTTQLTVSVSADGMTYTEALSTADVAGEWKVIDFPSEVNARYVQIKAAGEWVTFWGGNPFSFYGYAGSIAVDTDPKGITLDGVDADMVYPLVKGESIQLHAQMANAYGEGEITYSLSDAAGNGISLSDSGLLTIGEVGDGSTVYTATASVPNPNDADTPYTAGMKFVVVGREMAKYDIYSRAGNVYDLLDFMSLDMVRVSGSENAEYSADGTNYTPLTINSALTAPVSARYIKTSGDITVFGSSEALPAAGITSGDIDGFFPSNPLERVVDGSLLTAAQTPNDNLLGSGEVLGYITVELDNYYKINAVRVASFWNSIKSCYISYSLDGQTFSGHIVPDLHLVSVKLGNDNAEFMDIAVPEGEVAAKYIRLNITGKSTEQTFAAVRELSAYGEALPDVTVNYSANAEGVTGVPQCGSVAFGSILTRSESPEKAGHVFKGWFTDAACTSAFDFAKPVFEDTTLYAKWVAVHTVTFETDGGSQVEAQPVESGGVAARPADPTKSGYAFKGWFTDEGGTQAYDFDTPVADGFTLYAKWVAVHTVTFETDGGSQVDAQPVESGDVAARPADPTKSGYAFKGWFTDEGGTQAYDFDTPVADGFTLYAKWVAVHTVTFETDGGSQVDAQPVESGDVAARPADPTKSGYAFKGWFTDEGCTQTYDFDTLVAGELTLYAKWNALYTVTFASNGGTEIAALTVENGDVVTEPETPEREGYAFEGWFTDEAFGNAFDFQTPVTADTTLYAKWQAKTQSYTLTVNKEGAGNVLGIPYGKLEAGTVITLTFAPEDGFSLSSVNVNGEAAIVKGYTLDVTVNGNVTVEVVFAAASGGAASDGEGLTAGAIAAISICSVCGVAAVGVAAFFIVKKRKGVL